MTRDCDSEERRGGCPIQTGSIPACTCGCHQGIEAARGFLPVIPRFASAEPEAEPEA